MKVAVRVPAEIAAHGDGGLGGWRCLCGQPQLRPHGEPQRRRTAVLRGKVDGQGVKTVVLPSGPVQVKQRHPDFQLLRWIVLLVLGHVVDFLDFYWQRAHWPAFNLADSFIFIGAAMIVLDGFRSEKKKDVTQ